MTNEQKKLGIDVAVRQAAKWTSQLSDSPEYIRGMIDALRTVQSFQYGWFHVQGDVDQSWMEELEK